nr:hypothetical protein [Tanacetum cinerariifolium]
MKMEILLEPTSNKLMVESGKRSWNEARVGHASLKTDSPSVSQGTTFKAVVQSDLLTIANESGINKGARHFRAKVHYLHEVIEYGDVKLKKVHTDDSLADPFTKALAFPKHSEYTKNIGMLPASSLM